MQCIQIYVCACVVWGGGCGYNSKCKGGPCAPIQVNDPCGKMEMQTIRCDWEDWKCYTQKKHVLESGDP